MAISSTLNPEVLQGDGLVLRPWDTFLLDQMAGWSERGFPYHAFDLGYLRDPIRAANALIWAHEEGPHRHFIACEGDTAVGRVSVNLRDVSGLYIWAVHVPPEHEGRGVCRRMLTALMSWLEAETVGRDFVLSSNTFAEHAHRAYFSLGFEVTETRWHYDREIADTLWKVPPAQREPISRHIRFHNGRWEVRTYVMRRRRGSGFNRPLPPAR
jgi:ribosomal protein S18 acetylase RimI-like enzyme